MADRYRDYPQRGRTGHEMDRPEWEDRFRREREDRDEDERSRLWGRDRDEDERARWARERYNFGERPSSEREQRFASRPSYQRDYDESYGTQRYVGYGNPLSSSYAGMGERMEGFGRSSARQGWGAEGYGRSASNEDRSSGGREREGGMQKVKRFFGMGPKGYKRSDARIHEDVCDLLMEDDEVDATNIEVRVQNAEVMLTGSVDDRAQKRRAEDLAERVRGVSDVRNELRVSPRTEPVGEGVRISGTPPTGNGNRNRVS